MTLGPITANLIERALGDEHLTDPQEDNGEQISLRVLEALVRERVSYEGNAQDSDFGLSADQVKDGLELTAADQVQFEEIVSGVIASTTIVPGTRNWEDVYAGLTLGAARNRRNEFTGTTRMFYTLARVKQRLGLS